MTDDLPDWVFAYGSLLWNPGFPVAEEIRARLTGYHRSFCMRSIHHRGTQEEPGLVLALDAEEHGACEGLALRFAPESKAASVNYLRERELISSAYVEESHRLRLADGRSVEALVYVIDPHHVQYCGGLPLEEQAEIIAHAHGGRGPNYEYLANTVARLEELDLQDSDLHWLNLRVRDLLSGDKHVTNKIL